ncbi:hypothetical protein, partial [Staphylococcus pasteuri_A]
SLFPSSSINAECYKLNDLDLMFNLSGSFDKKSDEKTVVYEGFSGVYGNSYIVNYFKRLVETKR